MNDKMTKICCQILFAEGYAKHITSIPGVVLVQHSEVQVYPETVDPFYLGDDTHRECYARRQLDVLEKYYRVQTQQNLQGDVNTSSVDERIRSGGYFPYYGRVAVIESYLREDSKNSKA